MTAKTLCQAGRVAPRGDQQQRMKKLAMTPEAMCQREALPGSMLCAECRAAALLRLPDRSIGDRRGLRWGRI
jgi:hypothetical protein